MALAVTRKNFLGIKFIPLEKADIVIVLFGLEKTVSFGKGTAMAPQKIIETSLQLETFDEELKKDVCQKLKIATLKEPKIEKNQESAIGQLEKMIDKIYKLNKFPFVLGGEHSLTFGAVKSAFKKYGKITILQFDAHADLRDGYLGEKYSHAAVMRRCLDLKGINLTQVGIRNISEENDELNFWRQNRSRIKTFWAKDMKKWKIKDIVDSLKENVYLTFDLDAFDSSLMPSTGTPEPGGLDWYLATKILRAVASRRKIVGADIVELAPIKGFHAPDFLAAKLVYKIIGYIQPGLKKQ